MLTGFVDSLYANGGVPVIIAGVLAIALGALECFAGYRIFKVQVAIVGFLAGLAIGISAFNAAFGIFWLSVALGILLGVLLGWVAMKIYKVGVFLVVGVFAFLTAVAFVQNIWFGLIVGVVAGLLGMFLTKPVIIIATAFGGGGMIAGGVSSLIWGSPEAGPSWMYIAILLVFGILGLVAQFRTARDVE